MEPKIITGPGEIPLVHVENRWGSADISLLGATLIDWTPAADKPVIWLSESANFQIGKGIRGGVPICWPWFGAHKDEPGHPQHGFVRSSLWIHTGSEPLDDDSTRVSFHLPLIPNELWPHESMLDYHVTLGDGLKLELATSNTGNEAFTITQALHTYFLVGDVSRVSLQGLDGHRYLDKLKGFDEAMQSGAITVDGEIDRVYLDTDDDCIIDDPVLGRRLNIQKSGSQSTVVWNPWQETASNMVDVHEDGYRTMLCVETCNAATDKVTIAPGSSHTLSAIYRSVDLDE